MGLPPSRWPLVAAVFLGFTTILLHALGSHLFQPHWSVEDYARFLTALDMQRMHALALLALGLYARRAEAAERRWLHIAAAGFVLGTLCFSGSLYLRSILGWSRRLLHSAVRC